MKRTMPILVQAVIWVGLYLIFALMGNADDKLPMYYVVLGIRVLAFIVFFNLAYYVLLPYYFSGRSRLFYALSPLAFAAYLGSSIALDFTLGKPENMFRHMQKEGAAKKERPLVFILVPPVIISLAIFGVAATIRGFEAFEHKREAEEEANRRRLEAEIALLKSQINPHFLLNTLNNLYVMALTEPEKTPEALLKLSEMVSYILYDCAKPRVPVAGDIAFIENYVSLQRLRLPPNVNLHTELPGDAPDDSQIEPMILIPFIENAFKHGLTTKQACRIEITLRIQDNLLRLVVQNPIVEHQISESANPSGMGMANTRQRLAHAYPGRHRLEITEKDQTHRVTLELTLSA